MGVVWGLYRFVGGRRSTGLSIIIVRMDEIMKAFKEGRVRRKIFFEWYLLFSLFIVFELG